nr:DUF3180 domain-containing protein [Flexivirga meconopsidis]
MEPTVTENGVSWRHAAGVGGIVLVLSFVALKLVSTRGNTLPHNSWFALIAIVLLTVAVLAGGWEVRAYLRGQSTRPPSPQKARRALVAAQACVLAGAALAGWFAGYALVEAGRLEASSAFSGMVQAIVLFVASVGAVAVGLVVQAWCRIPEDKDDDKPPGGGSVHA